jgi:hypothetical protein
MAVVTGGISGRGMGEPDKRQLRTRELAQEVAARSPLGSAQREFWTDLASGAEREIAEDRFEDEEFGEEPG